MPYCSEVPFFLKTRWMVHLHMYFWIRKHKTQDIGMPRVGMSCPFAHPCLPQMVTVWRYIQNVDRYSFCVLSSLILASSALSWKYSDADKEPATLYALWISVCCESMNPLAFAKRQMFKSSLNLTISGDLVVTREISGGWFLRRATFEV